MGAKFIQRGRLAAFTGAGDIVEIAAPTDAIVKIHTVHVSNADTEVDDSTEIKVSKRATSGTGGATPTAAKVETGSRAFGGTVEEASTVDASSTETFVWSEGMSTLAGFTKIWTPELRPVLSPSEIIVLNMVDSITAQAIVYVIEFEEIGG